MEYKEENIFEMKTYNIATILLNYNSEEDLFESVMQLLVQKEINQKIIIVDNSSKKETIEKIKNWQKKEFPNALCGSYYYVSSKIDNYETNIYFVYNDINNGYSAGNNIGTRLADRLQVDAVLIANPDMRFNDNLYIKKLYETLNSDEKILVAGSRITGLDGKDQSPSREARFWEELLWFRFIFKIFFKQSSYLISYKKNVPVIVPKIMGCCLMLKMNFLREINYLDETTFLYSEEAILSKQVLQKKGHIVFDPSIEAIHAHKASEKGNSSKRMMFFIKSRLYYLKKYSGYNFAQLTSLKISYLLLYLTHFIKAAFIK